MTKCPNCGATTDAQVSRCPTCGFVLAQSSEGGPSPPGAASAARASQTTALVDALPDDFRPRIAGFEVVERVGAGGMGEVWRARQVSVGGRTVAIKSLSARLAEDEKFVQRFEQEARVLGQLNHPHIVSLYDFVSNEHGYYLVMEFVEGDEGEPPVDLKQLIGEGGLTAALVRSLMLQVLRALAYAHKKGVVHRDIKPGNVLIDGEQHAKIADFGIAALADRGAAVSLTQTGGMLGTTAYMAPEQADDAKSVDGRADVYSCGIMLYEMLTGQRPQGAFPPASQIVPGLNPAWDDVVNKAIQPRKEDRFSSAAEMKSAIERMESEPTSVPASPATTAETPSLGTLPNHSCHACRGAVAAEDQFCPHCSASLRVQCPKCSHESRGGLQYCPGCGFHLSKWLQCQHHLAQGAEELTAAQNESLTASERFDRAEQATLFFTRAAKLMADEPEARSGLDQALQLATQLAATTADEALAKKNYSRAEECYSFIIDAGKADDTVHQQLTKIHDLRESLVSQVRELIRNGQLRDAETRLQAARKSFPGDDLLVELLDECRQTEARGTDGAEIVDESARDQRFSDLRDQFGRDRQDDTPSATHTTATKNLDAVYQLIDEIRDAIHAPASIDPDLLREVAVMYSEACFEANERLRRCGQLLRQGLRADAIEFAERPPHLLDLVTTLDFAELPQWLEVLAQCNLASPPRLRTDVAAELNEAYAEQQPLEVLLKKQRMLALARSPLSARLLVLRRIAELDPNNPAWQDDLAAWEKVRLKQIAKEANAAAARDDAPRLEELVRELNSGRWTVEPEVELVEQVNNQAAEQRQRMAVTQLREIAAELNAAHQAGDVERGRALKAEWFEELRDANLAPGNPLFAETGAALAWIGQEEARQDLAGRQATAAADLRDTISSGGELDEVEARYQALADLGPPVPAALEEQYSDYVGAVTRSRRRKAIAVWSGVSVATVAVIALAAFVVMLIMSRAEIGSHADEIAGLIEIRKFEDARIKLDVLKNNEPAIWKSAAIQELATKLTSKQQAEQQRKSEFGALARDLKEKDPQGLKAGDVDRLEQLARSEAEKRIVAGLRDDLQQAVASEKKEREQQFMAKVADLRGRLNDIETNLGKRDLSASRTALRQLETEARRLSGQTTVSANSRDPVDLLLTSIDLVQKKIDHLESLVQARQTIDGAIGNTERYQAALENFKQTLQDATAVLPDLAPRVEEVETSIGELNGSSYLVAWNDLRATWSTSMTPKEAAEWNARYNQFKKDFPEFEGTKDYEERHLYLRHVAARIDFGGLPIFDKLEDLLFDPLIAQLWMIELDGGKRYYFVADPSLKKKAEEEERISVKVLSNLKRDFESERITTAEITYIGESPQMQVAKAIQDSLSTLKGSDDLQAKLTSPQWEGVFYKILTMLEQRKDMEPILRAVFFKRIVTIAGQGSYCLYRALSAHERILNVRPIDSTVNWLDPEDENARAMRLRAERLLAEFPVDFATVGKRAAEELGSFRESGPAALKWVAWLGRDTDGSWQAFGAPAGMPEGELIVLASGPSETGEDKVYREVQIGSVRSGSAELRSAGPAFVEGRQVYLRPSGDASQ